MAWKTASGLINTFRKTPNFSKNTKNSKKRQCFPKNYDWLAVTKAQI